MVSEGVGDGRMTTKVGIAGEVHGQTQMGAVAGGFGISGLSTRQNIATAGYAAVGIAGLDRPEHVQLAAANTGAVASALHELDTILTQLNKKSSRVGDRAAQTAWQRGCWFADYTYLVTPYQQKGQGGYHHTGTMTWRSGRAGTFSQPKRALPLYLDSAGYRRELTGTAPQWAQDFDTYIAAIELINPDGYAAWDYPQDRLQTLAALDKHMAIFPGDDRFWPVFSIRWTWDDKAHLDFARLPGWASRNLAALIPLTRTQRPFKEATREHWARQAIANALLLAADPDFRLMVDRFGKVMIGGMVRCRCNRKARHLIAAVLCELFPETQFWLLGQASGTVTNGLGMLGLLDRVWVDGSWWILDASCQRTAIVENGLITMLSLEGPKGRDGQRRRVYETFFTLTELMAANLRSLLAAYQGLWSWPPPEPLPTDLLDVEQARELKKRYQAAQSELGL